MSGQIENVMYYGANPITFERAKYLRENMTEAEQLLWEKLNKKQLGVRFKAQHPIDIFIADFYCHSARLVVEIDGDVHSVKEQKEWDNARTEVMEEFGISILRFKNEDIYKNVEEVINKIKQQL